FDSRADALVGVRRRHAYVEDGDVGLVRVDGIQDAIWSAGRGYHVQGLRAQQQGQALAQQRVVLGYHDPQVTIHRGGPLRGLWRRRAGWPGRAYRRARRRGDAAADAGEPGAPVLVGAIAAVVGDEQLEAAGTAAGRDGGLAGPAVLRNVRQHLG